MSNTLTKTAMKAQRKAANPYSLSEALQNGGPMVWLSCLIMGLTCLMNSQIILGLIFLVVEIGFVAFLVVEKGGLYWISMLPSLGWREQEEIWNDAKGIYE